MSFHVPGDTNFSDATVRSITYLGGSKLNIGIHYSYKSHTNYQIILCIILFNKLNPTLPTPIKPSNRPTGLPLLFRLPWIAATVIQPLLMTVPATPLRIRCPQIRNVLYLGASEFSVLCVLPVSCVLHVLRFPPVLCVLQVLPIMATGVFLFCFLFPL